MTLFVRRLGFAAAVIVAAAAGTVVGLLAWPAEAVRAIGRTEGGDGRGGARLLDRSQL